MQTDTVEKLASVGAFGLWAALHGWLGWLAVFVCDLHAAGLCDRHRAGRQGENMEFQQGAEGLWHKGGSTIMICVSVLTDIFLGLVINHVPGLQLPFDYDMLLTAHCPDLVHRHGAGQHSGKRRRDGRAGSAGFAGDIGKGT